MQVSGDLDTRVTEMAMKKEQLPVSLLLETSSSSSSSAPVTFPNPQCEQFGHNLLLLNCRTSFVLGPNS
jgi:hypothetical protein